MKDKIKSNNRKLAIWVIGLAIIIISRQAYKSEQPSSAPFDFKEQMSEEETQIQSTVYNWLYPFVNSESEGRNKDLVLDSFFRDDSLWFLIYSSDNDHFTVYVNQTTGRIKGLRDTTKKYYSKEEWERLKR